ncbi:signal peptidase I [Paenibacillus sp. sgz500958]|uniref:signal peptidase I n=1 Tax=Paenibacillus sp. sgz500958 TaxID=3242475 RepID=UPI0036D3DFD9
MRSIKSNKYILLVLLGLLILITGCSKKYIADGPSMAPTINEGDTMIVDTGNDLNIDVDDLIILKIDDKKFVKRVVAVEGDTIKSDENAIIINDKRYETFMLGDMNYPMELTKDEFYVLGDNIDNSIDSRMFGVIKRTEIVGKIKSIKHKH